MLLRNAVSTAYPISCKSTEQVSLPSLAITRHGPFARLLGEQNFQRSLQFGAKHPVRRFRHNGRQYLNVRCRGRRGLQVDRTPKHAEALTVTLYMYTFSCVVERAFRFAMPLVLASVAGGFQAVALAGFISPLAVAICGPAVGAKLDSTRRQTGLTFANVIQTICIIAAGLVLLRIAAGGAGVSIKGTYHLPLLLVLSMVERLCAFASDLLIERSFIPQLAGEDRPGALAGGNARLRQVDLVSEIVATLAFGWCVTFMGMTWSLAAITLAAFVALPIELVLLAKIASLAPGSLAAGDSSQLSKRITWTLGYQRERTLVSAFAAFNKRMRQMASGWSLYLRQAVLPASLSYIILMFNAVLSPGSLMTAFLASRGLTSNAAAVFRSSCALMGFSGTFIAKDMIARSGLLRAGIVATIFQGAVLGCAALIYHFKLAAVHSGKVVAGETAMRFLGGVPVVVWSFIALIAVSRLGLFMFDLVVTQIVQMAVPPEQAASVGSAEMALCNISELLMLGVAAVWSEPQSFGLLVNLSTVAVTLGTVLFIFWAFKTPDDRFRTAQVLQA